MRRRRVSDLSWTRGFVFRATVAFWSSASLALSSFVSGSTISVRDRMSEQVQELEQSEQLRECPLDAPRARRIIAKPSPKGIVRNYRKIDT